MPALTKVHSEGESNSAPPNHYSAGHVASGPISPPLPRRAAQSASSGTLLLGVVRCRHAARGAGTLSAMGRSGDPAAAPGSCLHVESSGWHQRYLGWRRSDWCDRRPRTVVSSQVELSFRNARTWLLGGRLPLPPMARPTRRTTEPLIRSRALSRADFEPHPALFALLVSFVAFYRTREL